MPPVLVSWRLPAGQQPPAGDQRERPAAISGCTKAGDREAVSGLVGPVGSWGDIGFLVDR